MKSPRDRRSCWRGGILQVMLGSPCNLACTHCTQISNVARKAGFMTPEQAEIAFHSLAGYWGVVGIFGGSPTLSPHFGEICAIARRHFPREQLGVWTNALHGKGATCRETFNPAVSNLNLHTVRDEVPEFERDWPEAVPFLKGLDGDSRHSPPFVAMQDMEDMTDAERWDLVGGCDVNQKWSALVGVVRGEVRGYFCELAYAQAVLHEHDESWPMLGVEAVPGWWDRGMDAFRDQVNFHCMACGHPLRGAGDFAMTGTVEQVSRTHADLYRLKRPAGKSVELVTRRSQLGPRVDVATNYIENARLGIPKLAEARPRIDALTTCVGPHYAPLLARSLATWLDGADTVTVVTVPGDPALDVCEKLASPKVHIVTTGAFFEHGAAFNKFAALGVAHEAMRRAGDGGDWVLHFDADTCAEKGWHAKAKARMARGFLGGVHRYDDRGRRIPDDPFGCGFVHLWHASDPLAQRRPLWEPWWGHAGHGDREFLERWRAAGKVRDLGFRATHIGEPRANWFGVGFGDEHASRARMAELHRIGLAQARFEERPLDLPRPWVAEYVRDGLAGKVTLASEDGEVAA